MNVYVRTTYRTDYDVGLHHRDYTAIDIETTGFNPETDEIIELAAVRYRDGNEVNRFQSLVKPKGHIPEEIEMLTGINDAMVADAPEISDILPSYLLFLGNDVLLGHNIKFDMGFIDEAAEALDLDEKENKWNDTMFLSRDIFKGEKSHKLKDLCSRLHIQDLQEHRALSDCIRTHFCYEATREYCEENNITLKKHKKPSSISNPSDNSLEWDEEKIKALSDNDFLFYATTYFDYAKSYIDNAKSISSIVKISPYAYTQDQIDAEENRVKVIQKHTIFLESELARRKADVNNNDVLGTKSSSNHSTAIANKSNFLSSLQFLIFSLIVPIVGLVLIFFNYTVPGIAAFGIGLVLLLISYFNQ